MNGASQREGSRWIQWLAFGALAVAFYAFAQFSNRSPLLGQEAPELSLAVAAGAGSGGPSHVRLSDMSGSVVVLDFWASWCSACRKTTPILNTLQEEFESRDISFYAVNVEPIEKRRVALAHEDFGTDFPTLHDRGGLAQREYAVRVLPTVVVVGRDGVVEFASVRVPSESELRDAISTALN